MKGNMKIHVGYQAGTISKLAFCKFKFSVSRYVEVTAIVSQAQGRGYLIEDFHMFILPLSSRGYLSIY